MFEIPPAIEEFPFWKKRRYLVVLMTFFGLFSSYSMRVNLSVAVVAMTESQNVTLTNGTVVTVGQAFDWNAQQKGLVLSSFFYGYICTQIVGGVLAIKFKPNLIFGFGVLVNAFLSILNPLAIKHNFYLFIFIRIIMGAFQGLTTPCVHALWSKWAPPFERSRMTSFARMGSYTGTIVGVSFSGVLAQFFGWESIFYTFGAIAYLWFLLWILTVSESPEKDPKCTNIELNYISKNLSQNIHPTQPVKTPWKQILKSKPVWAVFIAQFAENWGLFTLLTQFPSYLDDMLDSDLKRTGLIAALPYIAMSVVVGLAGYLADSLIINKYLTTLQVRKYFTCGAHLLNGFFLILAAYFVHPVGSIVCIVVAAGLGTFSNSGFIVNLLDLAPQFSSILMGLTKTVGAIPGIISPIVAAFIVKNQDEAEWSQVFYLAAANYAISSIIYWFWASADLQPWAVESK